ncbi:MAG: ATP-grasp domain-containing protein, partial [Pseudomonadota bacterium]
GMRIVYDRKSLMEFAAEAIQISPEHPVLIDHFLEDAIEIDVDAVSDGIDTIICGIMEHIEEAGIHSGDSACVLPPHTLKKSMIRLLSESTRAMAKELDVIGLMNVQYAIKDDQLFILEVNPRASRTIPFVSKATGISFAKIATKAMLGKKLKDMGVTQEIIPNHISVKESVFPFDRFPGVDTLLGPEMKSTGEVMGIDIDFGAAYAKSQLATGQKIPLSGKVFISVRDHDQNNICKVAKRFIDMGFSILATRGTAKVLNEHGVTAETVKKVSEGRPHVVDHIKNGDIQLAINTSLGKGPARDGYQIRRAVLERHVPYVTTVAAAMAMASAIEAMQKSRLSINSLQEYHNH